MAKKFLALLLAVLMLLSVCSCNIVGEGEGTTPAGDVTDPDGKVDATPSDTTPDDAADVTPSEAPDADGTPEGNEPPKAPAVTTEREFSKLY